jgi:sulfatase modifying factor 1
MSQKNLFMKKTSILFLSFALMGLLLFGLTSMADQQQNGLENMIKIGNFAIDKYEFPNKVGEFPATNVTWYEAKAMCESVGKRLCTFHEWTLACRGPQGLRYMYSQEYNGMLCNSESTVDAPQRIGDNPATCVSGYGVYDMLGNVWEWVSPSGNEAVSIRGGAWSSSRCAECALKFWEGKPDTQSNRAGFRCCR